MKNDTQIKSLKFFFVHTGTGQCRHRRFGRGGQLGRGNAQLRTAAYLVLCATSGVG